jgi:hypothetical protein
MPTDIFLNCNPTAVGVLQDLNNREVVVDVEASDFVSASVELTSGTWSSSRLDLQYANTRLGPWFDFGTAVHFDNANQTSNLVAAVGKYVRVYVHTALSSGAKCNVFIHHDQGPRATISAV